MHFLKEKVRSHKYLHMYVYYTYLIHKCIRYIYMYVNINLFLFFIMLFI